MKLSIALSALSAAVSTASDCGSENIISGPYDVGYSNAESSLENLVLGAPNFAPADPNRPIDGLDLGAGKFIPFDVYYPTDATAGDPATFSLAGTPFSITLNGAIAGPPISTPETCWPLVIQSHGSGSIPVGQYDLSIDLASHGYIVITPVHIGDVLGFPIVSEPIDVAESRVLDMKSVLDYVHASPLGLLVCPGQIAAIGVSFGGFSALAAANGYTSPGNDPLNPEVKIFDADERINAVVAMAPLARIFLGTPLADLVESDVPTLVLAAEYDEVTPILSDAGPLWDTIRCTTEQTYRVDLAGAGHSSPASACDIIDQFEVAFATILAPLALLIGLDVATIGIEGVCASIDPADSALAATLALLGSPDVSLEGLVGGCSLYFGQLPTKVSAGCMVDDDVCDFFDDIRDLLLQQVPSFNPATDCTQATAPIEFYVCSVFGTLVQTQGDDPPKPFLDPTVCRTLTLPTLSGDDAKEITNTYVVSYLQTVFDRDVDGECFEEALGEEYAEEMALPVVEDTLFLEESVEDECDIASEDV